MIPALTFLLGLLAGLWLDVAIIWHVERSLGVRGVRGVRQTFVSDPERER